MNTDPEVTRHDCATCAEESIYPELWDGLTLPCLVLESTKKERPHE